ncbi:grpE protein homolog 1, mitochondrial-like [Biomphalaria glabrata]|uniref:GrpE protein homolog 1, mitochondrial-like n=1 Tax=Biomphalaria glabrata TaxID=6526 RepID=A0A9U8EKP1_BIOGL|nr:grpE protein homolog 1, mitochondrial-like [Biomphalaria glabrata]KAI8777482.1 grpE protein 1, mitochondrial [Biomphalaria glabrata]
MATSTCVFRVLNYSSKLSKNIFLNCSYRSRCLLSTTANENNSTPKDQPPTQQQADTDEQVKTDPQILKLETQIKNLQEEVKEAKDKYLRSLAETENLRKRLTRQVDEAKLFAIQSFCKDLLEVSDVLSTAINSVPKDQLTPSNPHLMNLYQGLNMTETQLMKVFNKHGLESIAPKEGEKFDPNFHEALFQVPIQSKETQVPDTVAVVQKLGYMLRSRTLRPALVGVFK